jgi:hypothetical protein
MLLPARRRPAGAEIIAALLRRAAFPVEWWPPILACFLPGFLAIDADKL